MPNEQSRLARVGTVASHLVALTCLSLTPQALHAEAGGVRYVQRAGPAWDQYTASSDTNIQASIRSAVSRIATYSPYFNDKLSWMPNAWVYFDSYAIYTSSPLASQHPEWILKDSYGNKLYIPWGCSNGTCPQYAGDISNPAFINYQINQIQSAVGAGSAVPYGFKGVWLDDVNVDMNTGNGQGKFVAPMDYQTKKVMTAGAWSNYFASYVEKLRMALPRPIEILHNAPWFAGGPTRDKNFYVERQIAAADYINVERGFGDSGLTNGTGQWSVNALMGFIDHVHQLGSAVVIDDQYLSDQMYSLAGYFAIQSGNDGFGIGEQTPDSWSSVYSVYLGAPLGARYTWNNFIRRDFMNGFVLLNLPGNATQTVLPPKPTVYDSNGNAITSITLGSKQGGIYLYKAQ